MGIVRKCQWATIARVGSLRVVVGVRLEIRGMKRLLVVGLFASACLVRSSVAESERGAGGITVLGNGDVNGDNSLDLSDAIYLLAHLFQGGPAPAD